MTAALPKEEAPRCPTCARCGRQKADPAFSVFPHIYELEHCLAEIPCAQSTYLEIKCYRLGYERSTAAHQKTLDALEALKKWADSPELNGAITLAWVHGHRVSDEFSAGVGAVKTQVAAALLAGGRNV